MCGIAGFVLNSNAINQSLNDIVYGMIDYMHQRGPDANAVLVNDCAALGHCRLAILDLDVRANQPMVSDNGRYTITFNGEIYNFRELRSELESEGVVFHTNSDTEVLLSLYARYSEKMLPKLRGMFAFVIWDSQTRELFLARDPYGIKPLYYSQTKDGFIYASQVKPLVASGLISKDIEPAGVAGFYLWGSVPEPWTLYRGVLALQAGNYMWVKDGIPQAAVCWHDIRQHWLKHGKKIFVDDLQKHVRLAVTDSVRAHLVSDVPICIFLSGGIDSAVVAGLSSQLGTNIEAITLGFSEFSGCHVDEVPAAETIAKYYGLVHHIRRITSVEFERDLPKILDAMDQPSIDGINTWFASKAAAELGFKVVLSGVGGDELFAGYSSFTEVPRMVLLGCAVIKIPGGRALLRGTFKLLAKVFSKHKLASVPAFIDSLESAYFIKRSLFLPDELPALIGDDLAREGLERLGIYTASIANSSPRDGVATVGLLESTQYLRNQLLRDSDWASMAHSLELRTPLVDVRLLEILGPHVATTHGISKVMLGTVPDKQVPEAIINRRKTGFSLPIGQWISNSNNPIINSKIVKLSTKNNTWARNWAKLVLERVVACE